MAASLLLLLDDIASLLDDVASMTKVAAKQTAGVLGDDLALNAQQVSGVRAARELPVVWAVARGSLRNKAILVPAAIAISAAAPVLITPLLMLGGAYLSFEGVEKLAHRWLPQQDGQAHRAELLLALADPARDIAALEQDKVKAAVRTDFILSAEIVTITLGSVATAPLGQQLAVLAGIALLMTVGVYGLVAGIVKLDDAGLWLSQRPRAPLQQRLGRGLLRAAPWLMRALSVVGTAAMFLVGGGILRHGLAPLDHAVDAWASAAAGWGNGAGTLLASGLPLLADLLLGLLVGAAALLLVQALQGLRRKLARPQHP